MGCSVTLPDKGLDDTCDFWKQSSAALPPLIDFSAGGKQLPASTQRALLCVPAARAGSSAHRLCLKLFPVFIDLLTGTSQCADPENKPPPLDRNGFAVMSLMGNLARSEERALSYLKQRSPH